jgi:D-amino-acid dehydrogenase
MHDVIVVGGGVVGATAAYLCAREGLRTLLLDRLDAGRATDAGAGIITAAGGTPDDTLFDLGLRSAAYYPALVAQLDEDGRRPQPRATVILRSWLA